MTVAIHRVEWSQGAQTALIEVFSELWGYSSLPWENPLSTLFSGISRDCVLFKNLYWRFGFFQRPIKNRMPNNYRIMESHLDQTDRST